MIEVLTIIDGVTFDEAAADTLDAEVAGIAIPVIGRKALLANERASGRTKDLADIEALESAGEVHPPEEFPGCPTTPSTPSRAGTAPATPGDALGSGRNGQLAPSDAPRPSALGLSASNEAMHQCPEATPGSVFLSCDY